MIGSGQAAGAWTQRDRVALLAVLVVSLLLREFLVLSGGQNFWPDESRYERSRMAARALWAGDFAGFAAALNKADHSLFRVIGVLPASLEMLVGENPKIPALFFAVFSVASLLLLWGVMRRMGESERVCLAAVGLLALSSTFLYYSRHLLPYDTSMAFGLLAFYVGLRTPLRAVDSAACGLFAACTFLSYNGYWTLAVFAILAQALRSSRSLRNTLSRAVIAGASFAIACAAPLAASALAGGNMLKEFIAFSTTVRQGSLAEGWSLPVAYLWHAEHLFVLLWAVALVYGVWEIARSSRSEALVMGVSGVVWVYGCLFGVSVVLGKMVVYGRLARQLVPFFCILTAILLERVGRSMPRGKTVVRCVWVAAVFQAFVNVYRPLTQVFPTEFRQMAAHAAAAAGPGDYVVLDAEFIYPLPLPAPPARGRTILQRPHPLEYLPFQYEGWTPDERSAIRASDISMRLVLRENP